MAISEDPSNRSKESRSSHQMFNSGGGGSSARMRYSTSTSASTSSPTNAAKMRAAASLQSPPKTKPGMVDSYHGDWSRSSNSTSTIATSSSKRKSLKQHDHFASPPRRVSLAVEQKEKILSLTELNSALSKEVSGLQQDKRNLAERVNTLEDDLRTIGDKILSLEQEKRELEGRVDESRADLAGRESKIQALTHEKRKVESEKLTLLDAKGSLESQLVESDKKVKESSKRAEDAEAVVAVAVEEIDSLGHRLQHQSFISEIAKKIELNGLQSCKGALRKELKRFSGMVMKAKEEVGEARELIQALKAEEGRSREERSKLERALEAAIERSGQLEKQEKSLLGHVQLLEERVVELETELRAVKAERERAVAEASAAEEMCSSEHGLDAIRHSIALLRENSQRGMEKVALLQRQIAEDQLQGGHAIDLDAARAGLEQQMKEIMAGSMEAMVKAEEQLLQLRHEVDGLSAALAVARDASAESERDVWAAVRRLGREDSWIPHIPASATYILALGLFAYAIYSSSSSEKLVDKAEADDSKKLIGILQSKGITSIGLGSLKPEAYTGNASDWEASAHEKEGRLPGGLCNGLFGTEAMTLAIVDMGRVTGISRIAMEANVPKKPTYHDTMKVFGMTTSLTPMFAFASMATRGRQQ
ncbi:myosin-2 heavy chain, non muscle-like [Selaginella moellendorffii]|uniref:myosin-2 heavy chain, non muscle-like n=1 Tax=Selaginella moellendorffii TaxID=88036 RepID=UPI000D1CFB92|nr:myosin-2 heavy chain, non muscle-like [Selaginella moellendorffii]|eukprot:XP_024529136.1 myosin-2 heavy chain, non muscle-like [Selaginella moellendorffii]